MKKKKSRLLPGELNRFSAEKSPAGTFFPHFLVIFLGLGSEISKFYIDAITRTHRTRHTANIL